VSFLLVSITGIMSDHGLDKQPDLSSPVHDVLTQQAFAQMAGQMAGFNPQQAIDPQNEIQPGPNTAFIGGIPTKATEESLKRFIESQYGAVEAIRIIVDRNTGRSKGYGFVRFINPAESDRFKAQQFIQFMGKNLNVGEAFKGHHQKKPYGGGGGDRFNRSHASGSNSNLNTNMYAHLNAYQLSALQQQQLMAGQMSQFLVPGFYGYGYGNPYQNYMYNYTLMNYPNMLGQQGFGIVGGDKDKEEGQSQE